MITKKVYMDNFYKNNNNMLYVTYAEYWKKDLQALAMNSGFIQSLMSWDD